MHENVLHKHLDHRFLGAEQYVFHPTYVSPVPSPMGLSCIAHCGSNDSHSQAAEHVSLYRWREDFPWKLRNNPIHLAVKPRSGSGVVLNIQTISFSSENLTNPSLQALNPPLLTRESRCRRNWQRNSRRNSRLLKNLAPLGHFRPEAHPRK